MAKKTDQSDEVIVDVQEFYSKTEHFIEDNKKTLTIVVVALAVLIGGYFVYENFYLAPMQGEAQEQMFMAEKYFAQDSMNLAINGNIANLGFVDIIDQYGGTKAANLAKYYLGIAYLKTAKYEQAVKSLKSFDGKGTLVESVALGAIGDAYMELGDLGKAASYYKDAANNEPNDFSSPIYLLKAGKTYELMGNYKDAVKVYNNIKSNYKESPEASDIDKYIARAESFV